MLLLFLITRRLHHQIKNAAMLSATTPPITPPATATVDCTELPLGPGIALTAEFVVAVLVASATAPSVGVWTVPMVVIRPVASGLSVKAGEADASGKAAAGEFAPTSATAAVMLLSVSLVCTSGVSSACGEVVMTENARRVGLGAGGGIAAVGAVTASAAGAGSMTSSACVASATATRTGLGVVLVFMLVLVLAREELVVLVEPAEPASARAVFATSALSTALNTPSVGIVAAAAGGGGGAAALTDAAAGAAVVAAAALGTAVHLLPSSVVRNAPAGSPGADILRTRSCFDSFSASPVASNRVREGRRFGQTNLV